MSARLRQTVRDGKKVKRTGEAGRRRRTSTHILFPGNHSLTPTDDSSTCVGVRNETPARQGTRSAWSNRHQYSDVE